MSKIGVRPIQIPNDVTVDVTNQLIRCQGPEGTLERIIPEIIKIEANHQNMVVKRLNDSMRAKAFHGLYRALIANMVEGVTKGFEKNLELKGVGYRAQVKDKTLTLWLGFSHPIHFEIPDGITIAVEKNTLVKIRGINKELVGEVAAQIKRFRPVEPYQGRGIKYHGELVKRKAGKSVKSTTG
jgi:large subunit ribosomal protein L6